MTRRAKKQIALLLMLFAPSLALPEIDQSPLDDDEGYLVVAVTTPRLFFDSLSLEGESTYEFKGRTFDEPINYRLIKLPAGEYYWSRLVLSGTGSYFKFKKRQFPISVAAGRVNYGGMFVAEGIGSQRGSIRVANRLTAAIEFLEHCCAELLAKNPLRFGIPGNDPFVGYYSSFGQIVVAKESVDRPLPDRDAENLGRDLAIDFFKRSRLEQPNISPNGRFVLLFKTNNNLRDLTLFDPKTSKSKSVMRELAGDINARRDIFSASWIDESRFVFRYSWARSEQLALGEVVLENDVPVRIKIRKVGDDIRLLDPLPAHPKRALVVFDDDDNRILYDVDVTNPSAAFKKRPDSRLQEKFKATSSWLVDSDGDFRAAIEYDHEKLQKSLWFRSKNSAKWRVVWRGDPGVRMVPILIANDDRSLTVISNEDSEFTVLTTYDVKKKAYGDAILALEGQDIESAAVDPGRNRVLWVTTIEDGLERRHQVDDSQIAYAELLDREAFGHAPQIVDRSLNERYFLVRTSTPDDPGAFFWLDSQTGESTKIGDIRPWLSKYRFGKTQTLLTTTSDGLNLESFLTLPDSESYPRPPLIVMPHGGPISVQDTRHFDAEVQLLATLGYAVLQTNYRGSGGRGRAFLEKGFGQWGRNIENDIHAALGTVIELEVIDEHRTCIFGSSYGGYSALISAVLRPEQHRCAASFAGVTDMTLLFHEFRVNQSNLIRASMERIVGDPDADLESLLEYSPVFRADSLKIPVFLAHGEKDQTVQIEHFERMRKVLLQFQKEAEFVTYEEEGHGFRYLSSVADFYSRLDQFFRRSMELPLPAKQQVLRRLDESSVPELAPAPQ